MRTFGVACIVAALIGVGSLHGAFAQDGGLEKKKPKPPAPAAPSPPRPDPQGPRPNPQPSQPQPSQPQPSSPQQPRPQPQPQPQEQIPGPSRNGGGGGGDQQTTPIDRGGGREGRSNPNDDGLNRGRKPSRSGSVDYNRSNNNVQQKGRMEPQVFGRAPERISVPSLEGRVRREERVSLSVHGLRAGYYHYDRRWCDDDFWYPYYSFDPYQYDRPIVSPWYSYASLPAYVNPSRCVYMTLRPSLGWSGNEYRYDSNARWHEDSDLDATIDDIVRAFERKDRRAVGRVAPSRGNVHINMDGIYRYSLSADDFYDMYMDAIDSTKTIDYRIIRVRTYRDSAEVVAEHTYRDPWGRRTTAYHTYFLEYERRSLVIREFGVSQDR